MNTPHLGCAGLPRRAAPRQREGTAAGPPHCYCAWAVWHCWPGSRTSICTCGWRATATSPPTGRCSCSTRSPGSPLPPCCWRWPRPLAGLLAAGVHRLHPGRPAHQPQRGPVRLPGVDLGVIRRRIPGHRDDHRARPHHLDRPGGSHPRQPRCPRSAARQLRPPRPPMRSTGAGDLSRVWPYPGHWPVISHALTARHIAHLSNPVTCQYAYDRAAGRVREVCCGSPEDNPVNNPASQTLSRRVRLPPSSCLSLTIDADADLNMTACAAASVFHRLSR